MTEQVIANASELEKLDDGLHRTISAVDSVLEDSREQIQTTENQIAEVLSIWEQRQNQAAFDLSQAQQALYWAEEAARDREGRLVGSVPQEYYSRVAECQKIWEQMKSACQFIESIEEDFMQQALSCQREMDFLYQDYITHIHNSSRILTSYAQLLRKSAKALTESVSSGPEGEESFGAGVNHTENAQLSRNTAPAENGKLMYRYHSEPNQTQHHILQPGFSGQSGSFSLPATKQVWHQDEDGNEIFNTPSETGKKLDSRQGKRESYWGTCGLVSCVNILRLAGYPAEEIRVVDYAIGKHLCTTGSLERYNGATGAQARKRVLEYFGIESELREENTDTIAAAVSEGRGVIISVYSDVLRGGRTTGHDLHAVTVTSVKRDKSGHILGFYICDSGTPYPEFNYDAFYTTDEIEKALTGRPMNVTSIIR